MAGTSPIAAHTILPFDQLERRYDAFDASGERITEFYLIRGGPTTTHNAAWMSEQGPPRRMHFWREDDAGNIVMTASIDQKEDALALFDPPLVVAPATLAPGEAFESAASMRVVRASNPEVERTHGSCTRTMLYVGDENIDLATGTVRAHRIEVVFRADLTLATTETISIWWVVPDLGIVREERSELTKALGLFGAPEFIRLELVDQADPALTVDD